MYRIKMAAYMYNVWSLAYSTHSLVFVWDRFNLLDFLFSNKDSFYVFSVMVW